MKLDVHKLDERIRKLQEIRKLLEDPEMVDLLLELIETEILPTRRPQNPSAPATGEPAAELADMIRRLESPNEHEPSAGLWGIRRK
jgi:hypothetical protein